VGLTEDKLKPSVDDERRPAWNRAGEPFPRAARWFQMEAGGGWISSPRKINGDGWRENATLDAAAGTDRARSEIP